MATTILLKRSLTTAIPASLANGEPAYTANGDVLYIGSNGGIIAVGGKRVPGTLTANQAIVTDSGSMVDKVMWGNSTVNAVVNSTAIALANSTVTFVITKPTAADYASATKFLSANGSYLTPTASATPQGPNTAIQFNDSASFAGDANLSWDKAAAMLSTGNSTVNTQINSISIVVGSASVNTTAHKAGANVFFDTVKASFGNSTVNAIVNSLGIALNGTAAVVNTTQVTMGANVVLDTVKANFGNSTVNATVNSLGMAINGAVAINSTSMNLGLLGAAQVNTAANLSFTGANVSIPNANLAVKDLNVTGNLVVSGTVTTVDATNLQVKDSVIKLADQQTAADTLDVGFYGMYFDGSTTRYRGLLWDASNTNYLLFTNSAVEPTTTLDTSNLSITVATLRTYLASGNLISNSSGVAIGANSTYSVTLVANSLSLSTALPGTSGGTGLSSFTSGDLLVGNTTNGLNKIAVPATDGSLIQWTSGGGVAWSATLDGGTY